MVNDSRVLALGFARLTGACAVEYSRRTGAALSKYADPREAFRGRLTTAEAEEVIAEDPSLIFVDVARQ